MYRIILVLLTFGLAFVEPVVAGGFKISDCPPGKYLLEEQPLPYETYDFYEADKLSAAVLFRINGFNPNPPQKIYPPGRDRDWKNINPERNRVAPKQFISNCLPSGVYTVRIEYYTRLAGVGDWLISIVEYQITLDQHFTAKDVKGLSAWTRDAGLKDHLAMHWPLFVVYTVVTTAFVTALWGFIRYITLTRRLSASTTAGVEDKKAEK